MDMFTSKSQKRVYILKQLSVFSYNNFVKILLLEVIYLANTPQSSCDMQKRKIAFALRILVSNTFLIQKLIIPWTILKILQNIHRPWREELLWIDHWLELWQGICWNFHANLNPQISNERLRNQRPTLVVPSDVSTSVKEIWIGNVLILETFLLKFLPAPEPFRRKDAFTINKF